MHPEPTEAGPTCSCAVRAARSPGASGATPDSQKTRVHWRASDAACGRPRAVGPVAPATSPSSAPGVVGLRDQIAGLVPRARVVAVDAASAPIPAFDVAVGTEALLHRVDAGTVGVVVFLDFDQELLAPRYRAVEQALWLLVRAARLIGAERDRTAIVVQTRLVDHEVLRAVATGDLEPVTTAEVGRRRELGFPPFGGLAEVRGDPAAVDSGVPRDVGSAVGRRSDRRARAVACAVDARAL